MSAGQLEWLTIALLGVVTFATRVLGVSLGRWIPQTPGWNRFMEVLPGAMLIAIVAPYFASGSLALTAAAAVTLLVSARGMPLVASMLIGIGCVGLLRTAT